MIVVRLITKGNHIAIRYPRARHIHDVQAKQHRVGSLHAKGEELVDEGDARKRTHVNIVIQHAEELHSAG